MIREGDVCAASQSEQFPRMYGKLARLSSATMQDHSEHFKCEDYCMMNTGEPDDVMLNEVQGYSLSGRSLAPCAHKTDDSILDEWKAFFVATVSARAPSCRKDGSMAIRSPNNVAARAMPIAPQRRTATYRIVLSLDAFLKLCTTVASLSILIAQIVSGARIYTSSARVSYAL